MKEIVVPASKSISNRLLILKYLYPELVLNNLSTARDTVVLKEALQKISEKENDSVEINIGHAGTAMRFLTALLSTINGKTFVLDGSERMRNRPIKILVDALTHMGAEIKYLEKENYPPLLIKGKKINKNRIKLEGSISSQYITALMLIAPSLPKGLEIELMGEVVSRPYIEMTLQILKELGVKAVFEGNIIKIQALSHIKNKHFMIEGDWSSASYFYGHVALTGEPVVLSSFQDKSLQGDSKIKDYFRKMGVDTFFEGEEKIRLEPIKDFTLPSELTFDLLETPDLAQTLAVTCVGLGIRCKLLGLQTLKIKETDRLKALYNELIKFGAEIEISDNSLFIKEIKEILDPNIEVPTYDDHRMAMSFAILQKKYDFIIKNPEVVVKSFPDFWEKFL
jgi:3-phosphoshikimate 1-carboxyvinyltransferase